MSRSISTFLRWAQDRLDREIESIEEIESVHGSAIIHEDAKRLPHNISDEKKLIAIEQVDRIYGLGKLSKTSACEEVGLHYTTYYKWRKELCV